MSLENERGFGRGVHKTEESQEGVRSGKPHRGNVFLKSAAFTVSKLIKLNLLVTLVRTFPLEERKPSLTG